MDATLEVRWFRKGAPPAAVDDWFAALGAAKKSVRTDLYLHTPDPAINVKLRAGKAQAKRRLPPDGNGGGLVQPAEGVEGRAEPWRKFSFKTRDQPALGETGQASGLWTPVEKDRDQHTLDPGELAAVLADDPVPADDPAPADGAAPADAKAGDVEASIELTRARVDDGPPWWTICVETEGAPDALDAPLVPAARHFFADFPAASCPLDVDASFGYAAWLCRMDRPAAPAQRGAQRRAFLATDSREHS